MFIHHRRLPGSISLYSLVDQKVSVQWKDTYTKTAELEQAERRFFLLTPPMKMEQSVPKRRHIKLRSRGITQKQE